MRNLSVKSVVMQISLAICTITFGTVLEASSTPSSQGAHTLEVWTIKQQSCTLGDIEVLVNESAFRWKNGKSGLTLTTHAPDWKIFAYNDLNKKFMELTKKDLLEMVNKKSASSQPKKWPVISGTAVMAGVPVVRAISPMHVQVPKSVSLKLNEAAKTHRKLDAQEAQLVDKSLKDAHEEVWVARDIAVPTAALSLLSHDLPAAFTPRAFIRVITVTNKGVTRTMMDTQSVHHNKVSADAFDPPTGYKRAESQLALFIDDSDFDDLEAPKPHGKTAGKN